jgi:lysine 2,3-aminomutase
MKQQEIAEIDPEPPSTGIQSQNEFPELSGNAYCYNLKTLIPPRELTQPDFNVLEFRQEFFPEVSDKCWNDWRWQLKNRICRSRDLERFIALSPQEKSARSMENLLPLSITPYYMSLVSGTDPDDPVRKSVVPTEHELIKGPGEEEDPLHEDRDSPVPGIVHRYPDRVLFLATGFCSTYCRYCTRSRIVGQRGAYGMERWNACIDYINNNLDVRDVLISGGDPLTLSDNQLEYILAGLRRIKHVEIIRIGSKVPAVLPQRITRNLCGMLKKYHPLFMSLHFTHPRELTEESARACARLADAGIPTGSQTVLLKGINDCVSTMKDLNHKLLMARVRPYYLYQCDPIPGSGHFRTTMQKGLEIIQGLRGHTSGYAVPHYVIDLPGGGGKTPVLPDYYQGQDSKGQIFKNFENRIFRYPESLKPSFSSGMNMVSPENVTRGKQ